MEKAEKIEKELGKIISKEIKEVSFNYNDVGGENGVNDLSLKFPLLCFLISLKRELVMVHMK